ncbi:DNA polymerase-3 subunit epsilon [Methylobacterium sp. BE186]|uniref:3'-5' exonuclease n=1 Tax=Methylobacterium sp. BE186 TaxID=2817715 RepID=UPI00285B7B3B|nr:3'-5' exonuclease [Methylobacterium sp. BE186]MDR7037830.1 DNA polymerase-3 subunit epsilon [Methylobacterium sp. BE186]
MTCLAIDFETANERRDSACAVGLAWIEGGRVVRRESRLIRPPELRFSPGNIRVHGILPADVRDKSAFPEVMAEFLPDLERGLILAHNAPFDMGVLRASLAAHGRPVPAFSYLCTLQIARRVFPDPAGCGLGKVAGRLGIRFEHHDAGEDAYACAEIALAAVRETGAGDVAGLARVLPMPVTRLAPGPDRPPPAREGVSGRALFAARRARQAPNEIRFMIRGSTGNRYEVALEEKPFGLYLRCSCMAGRNRRRCRHVDAMVDGDVTDLISANHADVERLRRLIEGAPAGHRVEPERVRRVQAA